ncbi:hypothetical protein LB505_005488 [Fusarium chuoi]|nr:hypothetical protein LB505_005488 [Fusarium chuoi]
MCKFDGTNSPGFRNIAITIQQWIQRAPSATQERWLAEEDERRARAMTRANEIMSPYTKGRSQSWKDHLWRYSIEMNQSLFTQNASDPTHSLEVDSKSCRIFIPCSWTDSAETKVLLLFSYGQFLGEERRISPGNMLSSIVMTTHAASSGYAQRLLKISKMDS